MYFVTYRKYSIDFGIEVSYINLKNMESQVTFRMDSKLSAYADQRAFVNGFFSSLRSILARVPQGSGLGPLLFLIYIKGIADYLHGMARLFAEDTFSSYNLVIKMI